MTEPELDDITVLEAEFPGWTFGARWATAGSGPEYRSVMAWRGGVTLAAQDADGMRRKIREAGFG